MTAGPISVLGYALLGLLNQQPSSGYDLRKVFAETAMGSFSDSPGAIYPALARLEKHGLIKGEVKNSGSLRRRRLFHLAPKGRDELVAWLRLPITRSDVMRGQDQLMLRFGFLGEALGNRAAVEFLESMRAEIASYLAELKAFFDANHKQMSLSGKLALDSGIRGYDALLQWSEHAIRLYKREQK